MRINTIHTMLTICLFAIGVSYGQKGPGGVSTEVAGPDSDCKLWLDVGTIVAADGALINFWQDESLSIDDNSPTQTDAAFQPTYRSDLSASINGEPIIRFFPDKFLQFVTKPDINASGPYTERSTFLAFRTGTDVTTRQMLYEQGGSVRGLNIFINNDSLYMGGYDVIVDGGDGTPPWGFVSTRVPIQPNTVYVVTHIFDGPTGGTGGSITGYMNGQVFSASGGTAAATGVGSLWTHPNAPGLGALNGQTVVEGTTVLNGTGDHPFLGDMGEFIAYNKIVNDAERIILENYLGAKYFANLVVNDFYDYQINYGKEVIGIGRHNSAADVHNTSQGRNCFEIEGNDAEFANANQEYLLIGNDAADDITWSVTGVSTRINTQRILRTWRADHTGNLGPITLSLDSTLVPDLPAGYIFVCLVDASGGATPDFNNAEAYELDNGGAGNIFSNTFDIPDGAYLSIGIVQPTVFFTNATASAFEDNGPAAQSVNVPIELNFTPIADKVIDFASTNITANNPSDYTVPGTSVTVIAGSSTANIATTVEWDLVPELTETYQIDISTTATVQGVAISLGTSTNTFTIFDDDNTPKVAFNATTSTTPENAGAITIQINRSGNTTPAVTVQYRLRVVGGSGTATDGVDYSYITGIASFPSGVTTFDMPITIIDDLFDEPNETVIFELFNISPGADIEPTGNEHELTIIDDDSPPIIQFRIPNSQGPETVGGPLIEIYIDAASSQDITVDYTDLLTGSASSGVDYTIGTTGTITILAGDTVAYLPLIVVNDFTNEPDETINFLLSNAVNATLLGNTTHTYTIKDYTSFEWTGCAGVGTSTDNIMWLNPNDLGDGPGAAVTNFNDVSPNGNNTIAPGGREGVMNQAYRNNRNMLNLDGTSDEYEIFDDPLINTANYNGKHTLVVFETGATLASGSDNEIIYEQGGGTNGMNIYINQGNIYFNVWSRSQGWDVLFVNGGALATNTAYIAVLEYQNDGANATVTGYLNGVNVGSSSVATGTPILNAHGDNGAIGGLTGSTRFHTGNGNNSTNFEGRIGDFIHYSDAPFNDTRRIILENHMSSKYNITLGANQKYPMTYSGTYSYEVAGIGQFASDDNHSDAQGRSIVRINGPSSLDDNDYLLWGHDNASFTVNPGITESIPGIDNRLHRVWRVAEPGGDVGTVNISFDLSSLPGGPYNVNDLFLLIDSDDGDFSNTNIISTGRSMAGQTVTFSGINLNNGQWFTLGTSSLVNLLPVELTYFDAVLENGRVKTEWTTETEINNDYFLVEKTLDGINYEKVGTVSGAGNSTSVINYSLFDSNPHSGISYYRLTQFDYDGTKSYSEIRSVEYNPGDLNVTMFPNPIQDNEVYVQLDGVINNDFDLKIFDMTGRIVQKSNLKMVNGKNRIPLNIILEKGSYLFRLTNGEKSYTFNMMK